MTTVIVFAGPTISTSQAREILDADYRSPARAGDVLSAAQSGPAAIAIIDGLFESVPSVWHKEILFALSQGIHVYGSSSMGALRAAELHVFGMIGVGKIFEAYRTGLLEDDDEVAVVHGPVSEGAVVQSEAMVNLREGLRLAAAQSVISKATCDRLTAIGKLLHYSDRSWPAILRMGNREDLPSGELAGLTRFLQTADTNLKQQDAIQLLRRVAEDTAEGFAPFAPKFRFERTSFFEALRSRPGH